ncbi:SGNH/GDSL hydrolase family protein [Falsiroseomonas sp.]|uniref:SGNH/GDSL hydrolase family protein n=1 Tax=Falsiroseomonas sp. TaxID=2870721 RepID=UPI003F722AB1
MTAKLRRLLVLAGLLLPAPAWACPDLLLGDSLAVGMAPYARAAGYEVVAQTGAGLPWLRQQAPRCVGRLVLVFGTNDLRGLGPEAAEAYPRQIAAVMERWPAARTIWATPGCFPRDPALETASRLLDRALLDSQVQADAALAHLPALHRGRVSRCTTPTADGVHPTAEGYRSWWEGLQGLLAQRPAERNAATASVAAGMPSAVVAPSQASARAISASVPGASGRP